MAAARAHRIEKNPSLQATYNANKENHPARTQRRVKENVGVSGRPPIYSDAVSGRGNYGDVITGQTVVIRRSRRRVVIAQRVRTNIPVQREATQNVPVSNATRNRPAKSSQRDASLGHVYQSDEDAASVGFVCKRRRNVSNTMSTRMVLRERNRVSKTSAVTNERRPKVLRDSTSTCTTVPEEPEDLDDTMMDLAKHVDGELSMHDTHEEVAESSGEPYAREILQYLKDRELEFAEGIPGHNLCCQPEHRLILIDWLVDVQNHLELEEETLHLGVTLTDEYLRRVDVCLDLLQLVGITCLFIACKLEEIYLPEVATLCNLCAGVYTHSQVISMERKILLTLNFQAGPTPVAFLNLFLSLNDVDDEKFKLTCHYFLDIMLLDYDLQLYNLPSIRAAAALYLARVFKIKTESGQNARPTALRDNQRSCNRRHGNGHPRYGGRGVHGGPRTRGTAFTPRLSTSTTASTRFASFENVVDNKEWSRKLVSMSGHSEAELEPVLMSLIIKLRKISTEAHRAVFSKYSQRRYHFVSLEPVFSDLRSPDQIGGSR